MVMTETQGLLAEISGPADLRGLAPEQLAALATELREALVEHVVRCGGHLGSNLGAVELTIALHRVFDSPRDPIVWDTGHQAYVHKMLTGRLARFARLRRAGGLSGYPCRSESEHDLVENSHASTALSYADGLAKALVLRGRADRTVVAVVGDGALTGGMAWEAMNNIAAGPDRPIVVVVNDNGRSYSPTVGGFAGHLAALRGGQTGQPFPGGLGLPYLGPVDGHDVAAVEAALREARRLRRPAVVHVITCKGRGYPPAEDDPVDCLHSVSPTATVTVGATTGGVRIPPAATGELTWTEVFGAELARLAEERAELVAITAAMLHPTGLTRLQAAQPHRVFDVGIAEQHAVTSAAGLAMGGLHPVVCIYATFVNRAFDQLLMDVGLHGLPVTFVLDRAGVTGEDGPSHHGMWDLALLPLVPGLRLAAPRDAGRLREELGEAVSSAGPTALRFPKGKTGADISAVARLDGVDVLRRTEPADLLLVAVGATAPIALQAAAALAERGLGATVVDPRWVHPVPEVLFRLAPQHRAVISLEDGVRVGGFGSRLAGLLRDQGCAVPVSVHGLPNRYLPHGARSDILAEAGLSADAIAAEAIRMVEPLRSVAS